MTQIAADIERSQLFEQIAATSPDILFVYDLAERRNVYANTRVEAVLGYTVSEFLQAPVEHAAGIAHPDDLPLIAAWLAEFEEKLNGEVAELDHRARHADGSFRWLRVRASVFRRSDAGRVLQLAGTAQDITGHRAAADAVRLSEERHRFSLDAGRIGAWDLNLVTHAAWRSRGHDQIFGYQTLQPVWTYEMFLDHVIPEDRKRVDEAFQLALAGSDAWDVECRIRRADGVMSWVAPRGRVSRNESGAPVQMFGTVTDITQRKEDEQTLRHQQEEFRALAETVPEIVYSTTPGGRVLFVNERWRTLTGQRGLEMDWKAAVHPDDYEPMLAAFSEAASAGRPFEHQYRLRTVNGSFRWQLVRSSPVRNHTGHIERWVGTATDIHEQKTTAAQLEAVFDKAPIGLAILDRELRYVRVNSALAAINGLPLEAHVGRTLSEVVPAIAPIIEPGYRHVLETGDAVGGLEISGQTAADPGVDRHWFTSHFPVDVEGERWGIVGMALDITARKRAEDGLDLLAHASKTFGASLDLSATLDAITGLFVDGRADWCSVYLRVDDGSIALASCSHVEPEKAQLVRNIVARVGLVSDKRSPVELTLDTGQPEVFSAIAEETLSVWARGDSETLRMLRELGPASTVFIPLLSGTRRLGVLALSSRLPNRYQPHGLPALEEFARRAAVAIDNARLFEMAQRERRRAEEANRAKDEFLAVVSHELRTPLNAILGWSQILKSQSLNAEQTAKAVATIERNGRAQAQLIEDILDVSRIITGKLRVSLEPVDVRTVIEQALEVVRPSANDKGVHLQAIFAHDLRPIPADAHRLQQMVWNLLANAIKFTPSGGKVTIRLEAQGSSCSVTVDDTGQGIAAEFLPQIFERFRQADSGTTRAHGGVGLGLSIVKHLADLHEGTIEVTSGGLGKGSRFVLTLPMAASVKRISVAPLTPSIAQSREDEKLSCPPAIRGMHILVVDDEPDARELLVALLAHCGATVTTAANAADALLALSTTRPDLLISDIGMPGEDGYALMDRVRALSPNEGGLVPAVALTAYARTEDRTKALLAGFNRHVAKPIEPAELLAVLANLAANVQGEGP